MIKHRVSTLADLEWYIDDTAGRHLICGEKCHWIYGLIESVKWSAWIGSQSGMVYLHTSPAIDMEFDSFINVVRDGWPKAKVISVARGFDFGDD